MPLLGFKLYSSSNVSYVPSRFRYCGWRMEYENECDTINNPLLQQLPNAPTLSGSVLGVEGIEKNDTVLSQRKLDQTGGEQMNK